ncbi:Uncharacterised protein [uncultured archaeon]|nr:Uncharacterised protein [uncultured archaeon]
MPLNVIVRNSLRGNKPRALQGGISKKVRQQYKSEKGRLLTKERARERSILLDRANRLAKERQIRAEGLKHESYKPGRFSEYYKPKSKSVPYFFMSAREEWMRGSTPGSFLNKWLKQKGLTLKQVDNKVPQIKLIPANEIKEYLEKKVVEAIETKEKRAQIDSFGGNMPKIVRQLLQDQIAVVDWAEQTYGIRINVPAEILEWLGKA